MNCKNALSKYQKHIFNQIYTLDIQIIQIIIIIFVYNITSIIMCNIKYKKEANERLNVLAECV